ncbi:unnamed protein product [Rotaria magnacalcarata]|uniref:Uncharacterized protein n=1 Tax=Rotaria magnacalcarata TaxID=392030 RepID=A0A819J9H9_9BILA|nr:unnamed protein product [Rotaria magnacalcarata]
MIVGSIHGRSKRRDIDCGCAAGCNGGNDRSTIFRDLSNYLCKKMIETTTMAEREENVYGKQCYAGKFGIRGVGFDIEDGALGMGYR